jgi:hypothetical protein
VGSQAIAQKRIPILRDGRSSCMEDDMLWREHTATVPYKHPAPFAP